MSLRTFDEAWAAAADVDGWMTRGQAEALYDAAARVRPGGRIVEIGSFRGRSTIILASAAAGGGGPPPSARWSRTVTTPELVASTSALQLMRCSSPSHSR